MNRPWQNIHASHVLHKNIVEVDMYILAIPYFTHIQCVTSDIPYTRLNMLQPRKPTTTTSFYTNSEIIIIIITRRYACN